MTGGTVSTRRLDLLKDRSGRCQRQTGPAVGLRDQGREIASLGQGSDKLARVGTVPVLDPPVVVREAGAERAHGFTDFLIVLAFQWHGMAC